MDVASSNAATSPCASCRVRELYSVNDTGRLASTENSRLSSGSVVPSSTPAGKTQMPCRPWSECKPM